MRSMIARSLVVAGGALLVATPALAINGAVPIAEPASWTIMAVGIAGLAWAARKRRK